MGVRTARAQRCVMVGYEYPLIARDDAVQVGYTSNAHRVNGRKTKSRSPHMEFENHVRLVFGGITIWELLLHSDRACQIGIFRYLAVTRPRDSVKRDPGGRALQCSKASTLPASKVSTEVLPFPAIHLAKRSACCRKRLRWRQ